VKNEFEFYIFIKFYIIDSLIVADKI